MPQRRLREVWVCLHPQMDAGPSTPGPVAMTDIPTLVVEFCTTHTGSRPIVQAHGRSISSFAWVHGMHD